VESLWTAKESKTVAYGSTQIQWSLMNRGAEREVVPACRAHGLGLLAWSPLAQGFLSGSYRPGQPPGSTTADARVRASLHRTFDERSWKLLGLVEQIAARHETSPSAVSIAWLLARPELSSVVVTARTVAQLQENLEALEVTLSADELRTLDAASQPDWGYPYSHLGPQAGW
jgi:aryl-alcohol dehydrogenase-like predicted oxidoreductase